MLVFPAFPAKEKQKSQMNKYENKKKRIKLACVPMRSTVRGWLGQLGFVFSQEPITRSLHLLYYPCESTLSRIFLFLETALVLSYPS